jgi:6,7-dimethyl-8-ribityllumazine synthase
MLTPIPERPSAQGTSGLRFAIVASRYNAEWVEPMVEAAVRELSVLEPGSHTEIHRAPGSFEIPFIAAQVLRSRRPDAILCLGVILEGETGHASLVAASVSNELCRLSVDSGIPVQHGVLLLKDAAQAEVRCLGGQYNRGTEAARAAVLALRETASLATV